MFDFADEEVDFKRGFCLGGLEVVEIFDQLLLFNTLQREEVAFREFVGVVFHRLIHPLGFNTI